MPDAGVPREWVDAAREAIKDNRRTSNAGRRFWELSGGMLRCGECGWTMYAYTTSPRSNKRLFYYVCKAKYKKGPEFCQASRTHRAEDLERRVWNEVRAYLEDPDRLWQDLDRMIELEKRRTRSDPEKEEKAWLETLSEAEVERRGYLKLAARGRISDAELDEALAELDETRSKAEEELYILRSRQEAIRELERDRDEVLEHYAALAPEALGTLEPEERHRLYKILRLRVRLWPDRSLEIAGAFLEPLGVGKDVCTVNGSRS